jgi:glycosyltransferase involved in cell wall biosynthesis
VSVGGEATESDNYSGPLQHSANGFSIRSPNTFDALRVTPAVGEVKGRRRWTVSVHVVQVTPRYPPRTGGVERHVSEVAEGLIERGHRVTVLTADAGEDVPRRERRAGVTVRRHRAFAPDGAVHVAPGILEAVRSLAPETDVLHAHNYHSLPLPAAALGRHLSGARSTFVATPHYHGASADDLRDRLLSAYAPVGRWALRQADATIAVSEWERERLRADAGVAATVVRNGVDVERFRDAVPEERDRPYLLAVGRLVEYKGVQHAVRALDRLPEYDLLVAGSGPYRERLETVAREAGVADRVEFLGYVGDDRLPGLYAGAAVHVSLSSFEAYGMTVAEALAAGTPALVLPDRALADWCEWEGCVCVEDIDVTTVVAGVEAARCATPSRMPPTWDAVCESVLDIYESSA